MRRPKRTVTLALALGAWALCALAPSAQAAARPSFSVQSLTTLSHLPPEYESENLSYIVVVKNVGAAPTDGSPITIADHLPAGVTYNPAEATSFGLGDDGEALEPSVCEAGPPPTCTTPAAPIKGGPFTNLGSVVQPGGQLFMLVPVKTGTGAQTGPVAVNEVTVEGGGAEPAALTSSTPVSSEPAPFGFATAGSELTDREGKTATQAGSRPYDLGVNFYVNTVLGAGRQPLPAASLRDARVTLPRGVTLNPNATPVRCTEAELESNDGEFNGCPDAAAIGIAHLGISLSGLKPSLAVPLYNMVPQPGAPAELAFDFGGFGIEVLVHVKGGVNAAGRYELAGESEAVTQLANPVGISLDIWGSPTDPSHDRRRGGCAGGKSAELERSCPVESASIPALTMPSACSADPLTTRFAIDSWQAPGDFATTTSRSTDAEGEEVGVEGCNALHFEPTISFQPTTTHADSPSGLDVDIHQPQDEALEGRATAALKDVKVTLPEGLTVNAAAASGLGACSEAQIGYTGTDSTGPHFTESPQSCPAAAKLGTVEVSTPLLGEVGADGKTQGLRPLPGAVYLAKPYQNPFGSLLALYLAVEDPRTGIVAKLAGKVEPDPASGRLSSTFTENPELPLEDVALHFFEGARAALKTPLACGTHTTTSTLTPWSTPEGADAHPEDSFQTSQPAGGSGACPSSEAQAPNSPSFSAGTVSPAAGAFSPFVLKLTRPDGSQQLTGIDTTLPPGLTGKLAGIAECSEAQIAQAKSREAPNLGALEQRSPSCPASSEVGTATVGAGAGPAPFYATGHAYLAGPYKSAPLSLVVITPAVAGPFDLGAVVVRAALYVNPETAQIHAVSDPIPAIIDGIPLDVRSIALNLGHPQFTLNPTSCDPMSITGAAATLPGQSAALSSPFQVGGCAALKFKPKLTLSLKGSTARGHYPALTAVLMPRAGDANLAAISVALPHSEFLAQNHIRTICTRVQFAAEQCPPGSVYGTATVTTPLLEEPLTGPVYLRSSSNLLPDLVPDLHGPAGQPIRLEADGRVDSVHGGIRNSFDYVPDAPFSKLVLSLPGGKKGLLVNSTDVCASPNRATVLMSAQNGAAYDFKPAVVNAKCKGRQSAKKKAGKR